MMGSWALTSRAARSAPSEIATDAVTGSELAPNSILSGEIASNTIVDVDLSGNSVGSDELKNDAVTGLEMAADSVSSQELADNSIASSHLKSSVVGQDEIGADAVGAGELLDIHEHQIRPGRRRGRQRPQRGLGERRRHRELYLGRADARRFDRVGRRPAVTRRLR